MMIQNMTLISSVIICAAPSVNPACSHSLDKRPSMVAWIRSTGILLITVANHSVPLAHRGSKDKRHSALRPISRERIPGSARAVSVITAAIAHTPEIYPPQL